MPKFAIKQNENAEPLSSEAGERDIFVKGPEIRIQEDDLGLYGARPSIAYASITRKLDCTGTIQGKLTLLMAAVESRAWDNRDNQEDNWPVISITLDRPAVPSPIDVQQIELKRVLVDSWRLTWKTSDGAGNGVDFREEIRFRSSNIKKTALFDGNPSTSVTLD